MSALPPNPLWRAPAPLGLASKSAARRALLEAARLPYEVIAVEVDERGLEEQARANGAGPAEVALALARAKALAGATMRPELMVIGADQTLALAGVPFHKPADRGAARAQLEALSGRSHELHSAVAVAKDGAIRFERVETARLAMRPLDTDALDAYLDAAGDTVTASVGAYQLEGLGIHLFEKVEGDHTVILGLPLLPLLEFLRGEGALL